MLSIIIMSEIFFGDFEEGMGIESEWAASPYLLEIHQ